jgi:hypothetical protein
MMKQADAQVFTLEGSLLCMHAWQLC